VNQKYPSAKQLENGKLVATSLKGIVSSIIQALTGILRHFPMPTISRQRAYYRFRDQFLKLQQASNFIPSQLSLRQTGRSMNFVYKNLYESQADKVNYVESVEQRTNFCGAYNS
jgi:hypothetical protein